MQKILYFDCFAGISGDMTVGALLDLGIDVQCFREMLDSLNVEGYQVKIEKKEATGGILGTDFNIVVEEQHRHRYLRDITKIISESGINEEAKSVSLEIFTRIAAAEAKVHGTTIDQIHFHEVGAVDSIVDIVGAAICMTMLNIDKVYASPLHVGSGLVECAHGILPVPAPATVEILNGVPVYSTSVRGELVTPTGAAIIRTLAAEFNPLPAMIIEKTGYGTGKKDFGIPNALRVFMGIEEPQGRSHSRKLVMLETNIDDMNPEVFSYVVPMLLEKGALDVFLTGIIMKKGRPGTKLNVLCRPR
jgi:pyridinium-3,5-bisthiocarboxylic acid mononucleotide nickel chelatase